ncbi:uncharacterized protein (DUF2236 family) [Isoptericola variabilis J7]|nr:uncharacterized protein (DUF2236 family) [Isoptericola variabilis J7]
MVKPRGLDGPPVRIVDVPADDAIDAADDAVEALLEEGWDPGQIALLATGRRHPEQVNVVEHGGHAAYWDAFFAEEDVFYGHVLGFKGLERQVVVLAVNGVRDAGRAREMLYTGLSRARVLLVVVGDRSWIEQVGGEAVRKRLAKAEVWSPSAETVAARRPAAARHTDSMSAVVVGPVERLRVRLGDALFTKVAGPDGDVARDRIHLTPGPRWFPPGSPIRRVHGDAAMFVGGLRALLLQSLHPLAMAGVAGHSGYRSDPWGRLARTSTFLAFATFATIADAEEMIERVRSVHERVRGKTPDGRPYRASDPHLLSWVHVAEADSFLAAHQRYGERRLTPSEVDEYLRQSARIARALGADVVPETRAELTACLEEYRPELEPTPEALDAARFLLREPPLPAPARPPYGMLGAGAVALLPPWAREMLDVETRFSRTLGGPAGAFAVRAVRWGMGTSERRDRTR